MIVTVTPAPAIDWTVKVDSFDWGAVNRVTRSTREPSGKGLNVSWALHRAGIPTTAVFPAGGETGVYMRESLTRAGLPHVVIDTGREVRTNITLVAPPDHSTKLNEAGTPLDAAQVADLHDAILSTCRGARLALLCGSLPEGLEPEFLARIVRDLAAIGVPSVVDTSGAALAAVLPAGPVLVKPNVHELADLVGTPIATFGDVEAAAREAIRRGAVAVLASLGADGSMLVTADAALYGRARDIPFVNSVGAGDALLSGYVAEGSRDLGDRLRNAILWASSAVSHPTTLFPIREDFAERVEVAWGFDRERRLTETSLDLVGAARSERRTVSPGSGGGRPLSSPHTSPD